MQKAGVLKPQWSMQHMQQKSVQRMFAEKGAYQEQDHLQRLLKSLDEHVLEDLGSQI
jgi:hypothetical protein